MAIAVQMNGGHGLGLINPALYKVANSADYSSDFFDIAHTGDATHINDNGDRGIAGYPAGPGWDPVTGLGTPNAANLLPDLVNAVNNP